MKQNQSQGGQCSWIGGGLKTFLTLNLPTFHWECLGHKFAPICPQPLIRKELDFFFLLRKSKNVCYNEKNDCNNIRVIAIVDTRCCNKIWGNSFVQ